MIARILLALAVLTLAACATSSGPPLTDQERCARFGGIWQLGTCRATG